MSKLAKDTIADFGDQWSIYKDNNGWYGSLDFLRDLLHPLLDVRALKGKRVAEIGSGTGRIVGMLLKAGVGQVYAIEPSVKAYRVLRDNIDKMEGWEKIIPLNIAGDQLEMNELDYVFLVGVLHHIPYPRAVLWAARESLNPSGQVFAWVYGREGNELYVKLVTVLRMVTTRLPHFLLRAVVGALYLASIGYMWANKIKALPFHTYINEVYRKLSPQKRRLVIYDQLNPAYTKYYKGGEMVKLFEQAGFIDIETHHRHGYSWSILCEKP